MAPDFDDLSQTYDNEVQRSIDFIGQDLSFFTKAKAQHVLGLADKHFGSARNTTMLDVGCGIGLTDSYLADSCGGLHGIDVSAKEISRARTANPSVKYDSYDGLHIPYADDTFEMVFAINVFHHVPLQDRTALMHDIVRVTKPGGLSVIYEHNPFNPLTRLAVRKCSFDADAILLKRRDSESLARNAGLTVVDHSYILFFPVPARFLTTVERHLKWLPLGAQYCVAGRK